MYYQNNIKSADFVNHVDDPIDSNYGESDNIHDDSDAEYLNY